jgi:Peptidase S46
MGSSRRIPQTVLFVAALALACVAVADEGLWTYERLPRELIAARRGVTLDDAWLARVQLSSVRLTGGCSAAFVSPHGLMITSRECAQLCLAEYSGAGADLASIGFLSRGSADEKRCRRMRAQVLVSTADVTGQVLLATAGLDAVTAAGARDREVARLEQACKEANLTDRKAEALSCEAVAFFGGGEYRLYKYRTYDDLRLAFAPERAVARFAGADLDFPRQAFDVALLRAYVDNKPASTDKFLPINLAGPAEREPLFVSGHPTDTDRISTVEELLSTRDTVLLAALLDDAELKGRYIQFGLGGAAARDHIAQPLTSLERELRVNEAIFTALLDEGQLAIKRAGEDAFRLRVSQDPDLKLTTASAFDEVAAAQQAWRAMAGRQMLLDGGAGLRCRLCNYASLLVRAAAERQKPDAERRPGFRAIELPRLERELASTEPVAVDVDILTLGFTLGRLRDRFSATDPEIARLFTSETPTALAERTISHTRLIDRAFRAQLWSAGAGAIVSSDDPLIALARNLAAAGASLDASWRQSVDAPMRRANERLARAHLKLGDAAYYSDATGTLRLSSGTMTGWNAAGANVAPMTTLGQMYERSVAASGNRLPASWLDAKDRINSEAGLNITVDNDIGAGCAGCALISAAGELVGVVFDGNAGSAAGRYWFDANAGRAVALDMTALREIMLKVYRADELMKEIVIAR